MRIVVEKEWREGKRKNTMKIDTLTNRYQGKKHGRSRNKADKIQRLRLK